MTARAALLLLLGAGCATAPTPRPEAPVEEAPRSRIEVEFRGQRAIGRGALRRAISDDIADIEARGPSRPRADDAAYNLAQFLRSRGFPRAAVDFELDADSDPVRLAFDIEEGVRTELEEVEIIGATAVPTDVLQALFFRESTLLAGPTWFVANEVRSAASSIESLYLSKGFQRVEVSEPSVVFNEAGNRARVTVAVAEGVRFTLRAIRVAGQPTELDAELGEALEGLEGSAFTPRLAYAARARVVELLGTRGHPDARVELELDVDEESGDVTLQLEVDAGDEVTIDSIDVRGNERTRESFVIDKLAIEPGSPYDGRELRRAFRSLYETGLFERVRIELGDGPGASRPIEVEVAELPAREVFIEPGYGSYEGPLVRAGIQDKNLFGAGRRLGAEASFSELSQFLDVGLTEPLLFGTPFVGTAKVFALEREEPSFTFAEVGLTLGATRRWNPTWSSSIFYSFKNTDASDVEVELLDADLRDVLDEVDVSSITLSVTRDDRGEGDMLLRTRGGRTRVSVEWANGALGSQIDFVRTQLNEARYFDLGARWTLATSVRTGIIVPTGATESLPLQERYFNGGENRVRSFRESELGPTDRDGDPLGGEAFTILSAELRRPLNGRLSGALFFDTGNVVPDHADYLDFEDFRSGVGLGLRYMLPVGPLRLDLAANPDARDDEDELVLHFAVGMAF